MTKQEAMCDKFFHILWQALIKILETKLHNKSTTHVACDVKYNCFPRWSNNYIYMKTLTDVNILKLLLIVQRWITSCWMNFFQACQW